MHKAIRTTTYIVIYCTIVILLYQTLTHNFSEPKLVGVEIKGEQLSDLNIRDFLSGRYQTALMDKFGSTLGFKGYFIKADNQISLDIFKEIPLKTSGTTIVMGHDNVLFEKAYINSYNNLDTLSIEDIRETIIKIRTLQDALTRKGIGFVFLITPGKPHIYPESLPKGYLLPKRIGLESNYDRMLPFLKEYGINYLDAQDNFLTLKGKVPYNLFPKSGTHWSKYAVYFVAKDLLGLLDSQTGRSYPGMSIESLERVAYPRGTDDDLAVLTNVFTPHYFHDSEYIYPVIRMNNTGGEVFRPRLMLVGGSFLWAVISYLNDNNIFGNSDFGSYNKKYYRYSGDTMTVYDKADIDFAQAINSKDAVVLETNVAMPPTFWNSFLDEALDVLDERKRTIINFTRDLPQSVQLNGFSGREVFGRWTEGDSATVKLPEKLSDEVTLIVKGYAFGPNVGASIVVMVGNQTKKLILSAHMAERRLEFSGVDGIDTIAFLIPEPTSPYGLGLSNDRRKLGMAINKLEVRSGLD